MLCTVERRSDSSDYLAYLGPQDGVAWLPRVSHGGSIPRRGLMKLSLKGAREQGNCRKPNCKRSIIHRHHKGCERMWMRHFSWRKRTLKFRRFQKRYEEFRPCDIVDVCDWHHREIHHFYYEAFGLLKRVFAGIPFSDLSWKEAESIMNVMRAMCDAWLLTETPGMDPKLWPFHNETT